MTESQLQAACYQDAHNYIPSIRGFLFSVPNGGSRDIREGATLKATGVVAGIPDMLLVWPFFIGFEFKTQTGVLSSSQKKIHERWRSVGMRVEVIKDYSTFFLVLSETYEIPEIIKAKMTIQDAGKIGLQNL